MNILITGITGFIGKNLCRALIDKGYCIFAIIRESSDISEFSDFKINFCKISNTYQVIPAYITDNKIEGVVHLATFYLAEHSFDDIEELIDSNITFPTYMVESCIGTSVKWIINVGTFWQHYNDEDYNPTNLYSATKEAFEDIIRYYKEISDIVFVTIELTDTYGKGDRRKKIFKLWDEYSQNGLTLKMSPGEQLIDMLHIDDVITGFKILIELLNGKDFKDYSNKKFALSSLKPIKLKNLAELYQNISGKMLNIEWGAREYRKREVMNPWCKFELVPGWKPSISLEEGIKLITDKENNA